MMQQKMFRVLVRCPDVCHVSVSMQLVMEGAGNWGKKQKKNDNNKKKNKSNTCPQTA